MIYALGRRTKEEKNKETKKKRMWPIATEHRMRAEHRDLSIIGLINFKLGVDRWRLWISSSRVLMPSAPTLFKAHL